MPQHPLLSTLERHSEVMEAIEARKGKLYAEQVIMMVFFMNVIHMARLSKHVFEMAVLAQLRAYSIDPKNDMEFLHNVDAVRKAQEIQL